MLRYKDSHKGKTCYIFGSGPTINKFEEQEPGDYIGCNHIIKLPHIRDRLKYYFFGDGYTFHNKDTTPIYGNHKQEVDSLPLDLQKFCVVKLNNKYGELKFTDSTVVNLSKINAIPLSVISTKIHADIANNPMMNCSIVLTAAQFALYCGYSRIYLVGCDCTGFYHSSNFKGETGTTKLNPHNLVLKWSDMHVMRKSNYPEARIIVINPVKLVGIMDSELKLNNG